MPRKPDDKLERLPVALTIFLNTYLGGDYKVEIEMPPAPADAPHVVTLHVAKKPRAPR